VYEARTQADLEAIQADLPGTAPAPAAPRRGARWIVSVLGGADKRGRWRVAERLHVVAVMGGCDLDLRGAELASSDAVSAGAAVMGGVAIAVPEGVEVDLTGFALMGGNDLRLGDEPPPRGAPLIRVRAFSLMGGIDVKTKRRREHQLPGLPRLPR